MILPRNISLSERLAVGRYRLQGPRIEHGHCLPRECTAPLGGRSSPRAPEPEARPKRRASRTARPARRPFQTVHVRDVEADARHRLDHRCRWSSTCDERFDRVIDPAPQLIRRVDQHVVNDRRAGPERVSDASFALWCGSIQHRKALRDAQLHHSRALNRMVTITLSRPSLV
jgi:hypothetical protein